MKYFGTDGVRGVANRDMSPELAFKTGLAAGTVIKKRGLGSTALIGRDTRLAGHMLLSALSAGFCSAGINVYDAGVLTTPGIAYLAGITPDCVGAVVSASHNPAGDNGIKFFSREGMKLDDAVLEEIEALMDAPPIAEDRPFGKEVGWIRPFENTAQLYIDFLTSSINTSLEGLRVVVDCANGAASGFGPAALRKAGAQVISVHDLPDGWNINDGCGSTHPESLREAVVKWKADAGIAFDGDADRLIAVDHAGAEVDGDQTILLLALHMRSKGELQGPVVATVMSNIGLKLALAREGIEFMETQVGDRYVLQGMIEKGSVIGGEQSGHIILLRKSKAGDGILSALHLLAAMKESGKSLQELAGQMVKYPQVLVNVKVSKKEGWNTNPVIKEAISGVEKALEGRGRLLVRPSGTEPLIRVLTEGPDERELNELAQGLAKVISEQQG